MKQVRRLEAGFWGIFRVQNQPTEFADPVQPLPDEASSIPIDQRPEWVVDRGDVVGNGAEDVLIGVPRSDRAGYRAGAAYLYYGPVDESEITDFTDADVVFLGEEATMRAGIDVALTDVNDAGTDDVVIGAQRP